MRLAEITSSSLSFRDDSCLSQSRDFLKGGSEDNRHPQAGVPDNYFLTTASASSFPGKNRTRSFAGTWIGFWSRGLTPLRAALRRTLNEPKPTKRTSLPL